MNRTVWLSRLLTIGGVMEAGVGVGLLAVPSAVSTLLLRAPLEGPGLVVARLGGGGLLALGIACWRSRNTPTTPAGIGVAWAFLVYNVVACLTLALAGPPLASGGFPALAGSILHGVLAAALVAALFARDAASR